MSSKDGGVEVGAPDVFLMRSVGWGKGAEFTIPPGEYYVGDPCYVLGEPLYEALHEIIFPPGGPGTGETIHVGVATPGFPKEARAHVVDIRTRHGDGRYPVYTKRPGLNPPARGVAVDSGGVAVVDKRLCDRSKYDDDVIRKMALFVTLTGPATVLVDDHNLTIAGYLEVRTNEADDEVE